MCSLAHWNVSDHEVTEMSHLVRALRNRNGNRDSNRKGNGNGGGTGGSNGSDQGNDQGNGGGNGCSPSSAIIPDELLNFPVTYKNGFVREDIYDLTDRSNKKWVQGVATRIGGCARNDEFPGLLSFRVSTFTLLDSRKSELLFHYFASTDCSGGVGKSTIVKVPLMSTQLARSSETVLTSLITYVQSEKEATRLIPPTLRGFRASDYYSAGCVDKHPILFKFAPLNVCNSYLEGFGLLECSVDASTLTAIGYDFATDPTCSNSDQTVIGFQRPLSCAPIRTPDGTAVGNLQTVKCTF